MQKMVNFCQNFNEKLCIFEILLSKVKFLVIVSGPKIMILISRTQFCEPTYRISRLYVPRFSKYKQKKNQKFFRSLFVNDPKPKSQISVSTNLISMKQNFICRSLKEKNFLFEHSFHFEAQFLVNLYFYVLVP